jgi:lipopolysaccharide biosynthesis glycosyltransferase
VSVLDIACAADQRYLPHSAAMIRSALTNSGEIELRFHYLHGPLVPKRLTSRLGQMVQRGGGTIDFHEIADERVAGLPEMDAVTTPMWYRIYLPELLPDVDRVLYLDVDTLVLDSLAPLLRVDLTGCHLGAVSNVWEPWNQGRPRGLGLPDSQPYFNSGVLLMNLEQMRRDGSTRALREYAMAHCDELAWPDQDALNVVVGANHLQLHPRWNCMNSVLGFRAAIEMFGAGAIEEARRNPAIRHFEGPSINKPWHFLSERRGRDQYRQYRRGTPWPRYVPAGITPYNVLRRARRASRYRRGAIITA